MEQLNIPSWRVQLTQSRAPPLDVKPGQTAVLMFRDEGKEWKTPNPKYKDAVVFSVYVVNEGAKRWFVRSKRLLNAIYELGAILTGVKIEVKREGTGVETKYEIKIVV